MVLWSALRREDDLAFGLAARLGGEGVRTFFEADYAVDAHLDPVIGSLRDVTEFRRVGNVEHEPGLYARLACTLLVRRHRRGNQRAPLLQHLKRAFLDLAADRVDDEIHVG